MQNLNVLIPYNFGLIKTLAENDSSHFLLRENYKGTIKHLIN